MTDTNVLHTWNKDIYLICQNMVSRDQKTPLNVLRSMPEMRRSTATKFQKQKQNNRQWLNSLLMQFLSVSPTTIAIKHYLHLAIYRCTRSNAHNHTHYNCISCILMQQERNRLADFGKQQAAFFEEWIGTRCDVTLLCCAVRWNNVTKSK